MKDVAGRIRRLRTGGALAAVVGVALAVVLGAFIGLRIFAAFAIPITVGAVAAIAAGWWLAPLVIQGAGGSSRLAYCLRGAGVGVLTLAVACMVGAAVVPFVARNSLANAFGAGFGVILVGGLPAAAIGVGLGLSERGRGRREGHMTSCCSSQAATPPATEQMGR